MNQRDAEGTCACIGWRIVRGSAGTMHPPSQPSGARRAGHSIAGDQPFEISGDIDH